MLFFCYNQGGAACRRRVPKIFEEETKVKKYIAIILVICMALALCACGSKPEAPAEAKIKIGMSPTSAA